MTQASPTKKISTSGWILRAIIVLLAFVIVGLIGLWVGRKSLAEMAVQSWCKGQDLACEITVVDLGLSSARIDGLKLESGSATPFETLGVGLTYVWTGPARLQIESVTLDQPIIRGELSDQGLGFYGLETLYESDNSSGTSAAQPPHVSIDDGKIILQTEAGEVSARFEAQGRLVEDGFINAELVPASLRRDEALLNWSRGKVDLQFERGAVTGTIDVDIEEAELGALSAQMAQINANITDGAGALDVVMAASADRILQGERLGTGLQLDLVGRAARPDAGETFDLLGALQSLTVEVRADELADGVVTISGAQLVADLKADDRALAGPVAAEADSFASEQVRVGDVSLSGDMAYSEADTGTPKLGYDGQFVLREIDVSGSGATNALVPDALPAALQPHARLTKRVVNAALSDFDFGASFELSLENGDWQVRADEPSLLQAKTGLTLAIDPLPGQAWLDFMQGGLIVSGLVELRGGGGPDFQTYLNDLTWRDGVLEIFARDGVLEAWTVDEASVSAQFDGMSYQPGAAGRFFVDGELAVSGDLAGVELEKTRLFGKVEGAHGAEGWRVQTVESRCVGLTMGKARSGTVTLDPVAIALCPVDGRFVRQEDGQTVGQIYLGDVELPFSTIDSSGAFSFADAKLDWVSGETLRMTIRGESLSLPMRIGDQSLVIASSGPAVSAIVGEGPLEILAELDDTRFSGTMIPANVRADAFSFDGFAAEAGFEGVLQGKGVHISDPDADPLYEPIVTDLQGDLRDGAINMTGALVNEKTQTEIADFRLDLNLTELNGTANLDMRPLRFEPRRFQPTALSEKLRGVLTNARGALGGQASFNILNGELEGTGELTLQDISFDTFKAGTVTGVNGRIGFWDILELRSEPHQVFTIAEINPGVPLKDGLIRFQLNGAEELKLEAVRWPFAGGTISVQPTVWSVNGENETIMVEVKNVGLAQLIEVLEVPDLVVSGTVSGAFPIEFEGANIMVREAILKADETGGTIGYTGSATAPVEGQNEYADYAFDALKNFNFTVMQLGVDGNLIGRLLLSIDLVGNNDDVLYGQPFDFGITIDSDLLPLLTSLRNAPTESYISEALALEREAGEGAGAGEHSK